ncbi:hypothetical protein LRP67_09895 [Nocardioides sp. cx-169]|uniref:choice-of-anchor P family protein n=1 Tax=Nocardioides sp. cx-169 TaxID=2899080 RepID=UPI001E4777B1|nr:choice-of-anchor P family protein [Nocardioides sp. cx-169]MCD4534394.1 hypothetical protein [Nocardioides sp. cx-169]
MRSSIARTVALAAACAAGLTAVGLAPTTAQAAERPPASRRPAVSGFGYQANLFGTKVLVNNVEVRNLREADLQMPCTRQVGVSRVSKSAGSLPIDNDLIKIAVSRSTSNTYRKAAQGIYGVRAVNSIGDISLGGTLAGVPTPRVRIQGLQSVADSFFNGRADKGRGAFAYDASFKYQGLRIDLPQGSPVSDSLDQLFDALGIDPSDVYDVVNVPVATLVDVLTSVGTLTIPGLGSIALGESRGYTTAFAANSQAYALKISVDPELDGLDETRLQLGRARSRISRPVPAGVFRSTMTAMEVEALNGAVRVGGIAQKSIPCEGTRGKTMTVRTKSASVVHEQLGIALQDLRYAYRGAQKGRTGRGFTSASIGQVSLKVPGTLDVVVKDLSSKVSVVSRDPDDRVKRQTRTTYGAILVDGKQVFPKPNKPVRFDGGVIRVLVQEESNRWGAKVSGLSIQLTRLDVKVDLARVATRFTPY